MSKPSAVSSKKHGLPVELFLVIGLPLLSMFVGGAIIFAAYSHGFTALPEAPHMIGH